MAFTERENKSLMMKANQKLKTATDPLERLRLQCLSRGANGIKGLARQFKIMDDDLSKSLDLYEFSKGCNDFGVDISKEEISDIFNRVDKDKSGTISFDEFLIALRPPMNKCRVEMINKAFLKMDRTQDGTITMEDLQGVYSPKHHPKFKSGEYSEEQVFKEFLKNFEAPDEVDGIVTKEEFLNYYSGVSASIDNDAYFDLMMRNAYKICSELSQPSTIGISPVRALHEYTTQSSL